MNDRFVCMVKWVIPVYDIIYDNVIVVVVGRKEEGRGNRQAGRGGRVSIYRQPLNSGRSCSCSSGCSCSCSCGCGCGMNEGPQPPHHSEPPPSLHGTQHSLLSATTRGRAWPTLPLISPGSLTMTSANTNHCHQHYLCISPQFYSSDNKYYATITLALPYSMD